MIPALATLVADAMGPPVCTPEWIMGSDRRLERAGYRVFRWICPRCATGDHIHRPFVIDTDGKVWCEACRGSEEQLAQAIKWLLLGKDE